MPFTKLANTAIDRVAPDRERIIGEIVDFAGSDLVCYRAEKPQDLIERQARVWQPVLDWARSAFGAEFLVTEGHRPYRAAGGSRSRPSGTISRDKSPWALTAIHNMTTLTGLGADLGHGLLTATFRRRKPGLPPMSMRTGRSSNGAGTRKPGTAGTIASGNSTFASASASFHNEQCG